MQTIPKNKMMDDNLLTEKFSSYHPLLSRIAGGFSLSYGESNALIEQVFADCIEQYRTMEGCKSYRMLLSKMMVHKCVLKVSSDIFASSSGSVSNYSWTDNGQYARPSVKDMPLTTRSVFILHEQLGFNEEEVSEILNTSTYNVRARFNKALSFLKSYGY